MRLLGLLALILLTLGPGAAAGLQIPDAGLRVVGDGPEALREIDAVADAGVAWVVIGATWESLEPSPGAALASGAGADALADLEAQIARARARNLRVHLIVENAPSWASGRVGSNDPPTASALPAYADFLRRLSARLDGRVQVLSPWNEPNLDAFWADPDPVAYAALQRAAHVAIRAGDPRALVGSAPISVGSVAAYAWIERAFAAGLSGSVDVLMLNAYPPGAPERRFGGGVRPLPSTLGAQYAVRELVDRFDPGRPIWLNELGWSTCRGPCSPNRTTRGQQADYLRRAFVYRRRYLTGVVERIAWFNLRDRGDEVRRWDHNQGLLDRSFARKPAYAALSRLRARGSADGARAGRIATPRPRAGRARARSSSASVTRPAVRVRRGRIIVGARVGVRSPGGRVRVQGWSGRRWRTIAARPLAGSARLRLTFADRGDLAVRVVVLPADGRRAWWTRTVPRGPLLYRGVADAALRRTPADARFRARPTARTRAGSVGVGPISVRDTGSRLRITARLTVRGRAIVRLEGWRGAWRPIATRRIATGRRTVAFSPRDGGWLAVRMLARPDDARIFLARRLGPIPVDGPSSTGSVVVGP